MYTLEDITLVPYIMKLSSYKYIDINSAYLYKFLTTNKIYDFKRLEEFMKLGNPLVNNKTFYKKLNQAYELLTKINNRQIQVQTYSSRKRPTSFAKEINDTDRTTMLGEIMITHPLYSNSLPQKVKGLSIDTVEYLRSKIVLSGKNALTEVIPYVGEKRVNHFSYDLFRYREQLNRIIAEIHDKKDLLQVGNLFYKDFEEKRAVILTELNEIISYMLDNGKTFIWGNLTEPARNRIRNAIAKNKDSEIKEKFANMIAKFVTLSEVENGLLIDSPDTKPIERFLTK